MAGKSQRYLALLRGINVGGNNIIAKQDLKQCFVDMGFEGVRTYIQSGNILFRAASTPIKELTETVEAALASRFDYDAHAAVISYPNYKKAVAQAQSDWGESDDWKHYALFTLLDTTPAKILKQLPPPKDGIEVVSTASRVVYWSVLKAKQTRASMMKVAKEPIYKRLTVRNSNTVYKLLELFEAMD